MFAFKSGLVGNVYDVCSDIYTLVYVSLFYVVVSPAKAAFTNRFFQKFGVWCSEKIEKFTQSPSALLPDALGTLRLFFYACSLYVSTFNPYGGMIVGAITFSANYVQEVYESFRDKWFNRTWKIFCFLITAVCVYLLYKWLSKDTKVEEHKEKVKNLKFRLQMVKELRDGYKPGTNSYITLQKTYEQISSELIENQANTATGLSSRADALIHLGMMLVSVAVAWVAHTTNPFKLWRTFLDFLKASRYAHIFFSGDDEGCVNYQTHNCSMAKKSGKGKCVACCAKEAENEVKVLDYKEEDVLERPNSYVQPLARSLVKDKTLPTWFVCLSENLQSHIAKRLGLTYNDLKTGNFKLELDDENVWKIKKLREENRNRARDFNRNLRRQNGEILTSEDEPDVPISSPLPKGMTIEVVTDSSSVQSKGNGKPKGFVMSTSTSISPAVSNSENHPVQYGYIENKNQSPPPVGKTPKFFIEDEVKTSDSEPDSGEKIEIINQTIRLPHHENCGLQHITESAIHDASACDEDEECQEFLKRHPYEECHCYKEWGGPYESPHQKEFDEWWEKTSWNMHKAFENSIEEWRAFHSVSTVNGYVDNPIYMADYWKKVFDENHPIVQDAMKISTLPELEESMEEFAQKNGLPIPLKIQNHVKGLEGKSLTSEESSVLKHDSAFSPVSGSGLMPIAHPVCRGTVPHIITSTCKPGCVLTYQSTSGSHASNHNIKCQFEVDGSDCICEEERDFSEGFIVKREDQLAVYQDPESHPAFSWLNGFLRQLPLYNVWCLPLFFLLGLSLVSLGYYVMHRKDEEEEEVAPKQFGPDNNPTRKRCIEGDYCPHQVGSEFYANESNVLEKNGQTITHRCPFDANGQDCKFSGRCPYTHERAGIKAKVEIPDVNPVKFTSVPLESLTTQQKNESWLFGSSSVKVNANDNPEATVEGCVHVANCPCLKSGKIKTDPFGICNVDCGGHNCHHFAGCEPKYCWSIRKAMFLSTDRIYEDEQDGVKLKRKQSVCDSLKVEIPKNETQKPPHVNIECNYKKRCDDCVKAGVEEQLEAHQKRSESYQEWFEKRKNDGSLAPEKEEKKPEIVNEKQPFHSTQFKNEMPKNLSAHRAKAAAKAAGNVYQQSLKYEADIEKERKQAEKKRLEEDQALQGLQRQKKRDFIMYGDQDFLKGCLADGIPVEVSIKDKKGVMTSHICQNYDEWLLLLKEHPEAKLFCRKESKLKQGVVKITHFYDGAVRAVAARAPLAQGVWVQLHDGLEDKAIIDDGGVLKTALSHYSLDDKTRKFVYHPLKADLHISSYAAGMQSTPSKEKLPDRDIYQSGLNYAKFLQQRSNFSDFTRVKHKMEDFDKRAVAELPKEDVNEVARLKSKIKISYPNAQPPVNPFTPLSDIEDNEEIYENVCSQATSDLIKKLVVASGVPKNPSPVPAYRPVDKNGKETAKLKKDVNQMTVAQLEKLLVEAKKHEKPDPPKPVVDLTKEECDRKVKNESKTVAESEDILNMNTTGVVTIIHTATGTKVGTGRFMNNWVHTSRHIFSRENPTDAQYELCDLTLVTADGFKFKPQSVCLDKSIDYAKIYIKKEDYVRYVETNPIVKRIGTVTVKEGDFVWGLYLNENGLKVMPGRVIGYQTDTNGQNYMKHTVNTVGGVSGMALVDRHGNICAIHKGGSGVKGVNIAVPVDSTLAIKMKSAISLATMCGLPKNGCRQHSL